MKKFVFLFIALLFVGLGSQAIKVVTPEGDREVEKAELVGIETTSLSGVVLDNETGEALVGVAIRFEGSNETVYTDFDGNFKIENVVPGKYNVLSSYISYTDNKMKEVNVSGKNNVVRLVLKKD
ncbi:carboxypeptidase-like regulatory domain-containing protein [Marinifilum caeruleilacunae]|uniref:Carboxypeptidase-like regulatory domain-containing protein n=1 Tax=Marinifilum caeruleilacunae TaxID=2499076 RepID=A0ABX1WZK1_9BACT|nr:carboxypeptidase-like regulatory domain-containing protein [Marinifilum caeruleilacunae]NOU61557.1 carboxypeptidase-like regulatory domain-containing protein [Marinifilum caeruleilacunae]